MRQAIVRPAAQRDLIQHFAYIGEHGSVAAARRFLAAVNLAFDELAETPRMGVARKLEKFPDLRMWRVREFERYLIFYRLADDKVEIMRVIHLPRTTTAS